MSSINGPGISLLHTFLSRKRLTNRPTESRIVLPICSALEVQSYKNALLLCAKALKKQPDHYIVLALKVLALSQAPRPLTVSAEQEITQIVEFLKTNANGAGLADPDVVSFVVWVLGSLKRGAEATSFISVAATRHSTNEDICLEAFFYYARQGDRGKAQQISMKMYKNFQDAKYLWWAIECINLQVRNLSNPINAILLSLAEHQISDYYSGRRAKAATNEGIAQVSDSTEALKLGSAATVKGEEDSAPSPDLPTLTPIQFESASEFHLVTRFLELRVLYAESLAASLPSKALIAPKTQIQLPSLTPSIPPRSAREDLMLHFKSSEGDRWCERSLGFEIWRRECELRHGSLQGGERLRSWERLQGSLKNGDSNWHTMLYFIRCSIAIAAGSSSSFFDSNDLNKSSELPSEEGRILLGSTRRLFRDLANDGAKGKKERGYLLGLLEIARESRTRSWDEVDLIPALLDEYLTNFSTKMCCFDDLQPYLLCLSSNERHALREKMSIIAEGALEADVKKVQRVITASKIARYLSTSSTEESENAAAEHLIRQYFEALPLGKALPATELQPADDFALLAGQCYVAAWQLSHQRSYLIEAIAILEVAIARSKYKYQIRILLINLLQLLGASSLALSHYRILDTKSVQLDTLSHLVMDRASTFSVVTTGSQGGLAEEGSSAASWYKTGLHESVEMPVRAFSFGNHVKIEDFTVFQERLYLSLSKHTLDVERMRMDAVGTSALDIGAALITLSSLSVFRTVSPSDNRDYKTLPNFQPDSEDGIWKQTNMGPIIGLDWLNTFGAIYTNLLDPMLVEAQTESMVSSHKGKGSSSELTESELNLLAFSKVARDCIDAPSEGVLDTEVLVFFRDQLLLFNKLSEDPEALPWELLHIATIALEGYSLFDLAVECKVFEVSMFKPIDSKRSKRLRAIRNAAKEQFKTLGSKVTAHGKQVGKQRSKTLLALASFKEFELMDEDHLMNFAHALTESRRAMAEGLAAAIHRRMK